MIEIWLLLAALFLAWTNGANDNFKGVATLYGSGSLDYRQALIWATVATGLGALASVIGGQALAQAFSGKGLLPDETVLNPTFLMAVGWGAAATILAATLTGLPVSTTHALTGALVGGGLMAPAGVVHWKVLAAKFAGPLLLSPLAAIILTYLLFLPYKRLVLRGGKSARFARARDRLHFLSGGAVAFARGLNDAPKIGGLMVVSTLGAGRATLVAITVAMLLGGWLNSRKVAETMSHKITGMDHDEGLAGNLVTAFLVVLASKAGFPVSTTHVSCGAIFGIGAVHGHARWKVIFGVFLAWIGTLPMAGLITACLCYLLK